MDASYKTLIRLPLTIALAAMMLGQQCAVPANRPVIAIPPPTIEPAPKVTFETSSGKIVLELFPQQAPKSVENFLRYVKEGFYSNKIFHSVGSEGIIRGGSYDVHLNPGQQYEPVVNESNNGLQNLRGRLGLYPPAGGDSVTCEFYINLADTPDRDFDLATGTRRFPVIGKVAEGMAVVDEIGLLPTTSRTAADGRALSAIPEEPPVILRVFLNEEEILPPDLPPVDNNRPPIVSAGADRQVPAGISVRLNGSASDPDEGDTLTYSWQQIAGTTVTLSDAAAVSPTFTVPANAETLTFKLTVQDRAGATSESTVNLTVLTAPQVRLTITVDNLPTGDVLLDMLVVEAPITAHNFLQYVEDGFYNGTIFHRLIPNFVIQGGGFLPNLAPKSGLRPPIQNEFSPDRPNLRGTVSMAKTSDPDSATSQFFINLVDNDGLNDPANSGGFAVFARVIEGMELVDYLAGEPTTTKTDPQGGMYDDVPSADIVIKSATTE